MSRRGEVERSVAKGRLEGLDRKKHWGLDSKVDEFVDTVVSNIDFRPLDRALKNFGSREQVSESVIDDVLSRIDFSQLFAGAVLDEIQRILLEVYKSGGSRVLKQDGDRLDPFDVSVSRISDLMRTQEVFLKNLSSDAEKRAKEIMVQGLEDGKTVSEMRDEIVDGVEGMTENRAETIAETELVKASSKGTEAALEEAGIERVEVNASIDRRTCEEGSFSWTGPDGTEYTSCREWDGEIFPRDKAPTPAESSHPRCRCALLAVVDD